MAHLVMLSQQKNMCRKASKIAERLLKRYQKEDRISRFTKLGLEAAVFTDQTDEFHVAVAENTEEAVKLVKVGFEYVTGDYDDGGKIFRKRK